MKKVVIITTFLVLIISIFLIKMQAVSNPPEKVLLEAFNSSGATMVSSELYLRGRFGGIMTPDMDYCKSVSHDIIKCLGADGAELVYKAIDTETSGGVGMECRLGNGRSIQSSFITEKNGNGTGESYVSISMLNTSAIYDMAVARTALEKVLNAYGIRPEVNSCITGCFKGKTGYSELNASCIRIFDSAGARKVEGIREGSLISVSAFTRDIRDGVDVNGGRVNLNLAIRYNSYEDKTYIWLATPVIITEY